MVKNRYFFWALWTPNYLSETHEILHNKIGGKDLSETVFRLTLSFLEAEIWRFLIGSLTWKTLYIFIRGAKNHSFLWTQFTATIFLLRTTLGWFSQNLRFLASMTDTIEVSEVWLIPLKWQNFKVKNDHFWHQIWVDREKE